MWTSKGDFSAASESYSKMILDWPNQLIFNGAQGSIQAGTLETESPLSCSQM
jgi:hypothetical protein